MMMQIATVAMMMMVAIMMMMMMMVMMMMMMVMMVMMVMMMVAPLSVTMRVKHTHSSVRHGGRDDGGPGRRSGTWSC